MREMEAVVIWEQVEEAAMVIIRIITKTIKVGSISTFRKSPNLLDSLLSMGSNSIVASTAGKLTDRLF